MNAVGHDGYEQHPLLHRHVRDIASKGEGELTAVTHELHSGGRVVRVAHVRPPNGIEWTTSADNVLAADPQCVPLGSPRPAPSEAPRLPVRRVRSRASSEPTLEDTLFHHMDRLPTGTPLPMGHTTAPPWGVQRMAPYPAMAPSWGRAELDPDTQTTRYVDPAGKLMEMAKHGTSTGTNPRTNTGNPSDGSSGGGSGGGDSDTGNDSDQ